MLRSCTQAGQRLTMIRRAIALVSGQVVPGILLIERLHSPIAFTEHFYEAEPSGAGGDDEGPTGGRTWDGRVNTGHDQALMPLLPQREFLYPAEDVTTSSVRAISAELIREKLFRLLGQELPYSTAVEIETFEEKPALTRIRAVILVDKPGQKAIVIGKGGVKLKEIGSAARADIEKLVGGKVFLELWVKVKQSWADDRRTLDRLGLS